MEKENNFKGARRPRRKVCSFCVDKVEAIDYKDFNIVVTPLLSIICGIVLKIICDQLIVMRILAIILCTVILFITYKILQKLKVNKYLTFLDILI